MADVPKKGVQNNPPMRRLGATIDTDETVMIPVRSKPAQAAPDSDETLPRVADPSGRYQVGELLGQGGMAEVYKAYDTTMKRHVALKLLHPGLASDEDFRARFVSEANMAGGMAHPNIVVVHDVGLMGSRPFIAMELLEGETLSALLARETVLGVREVAQIGAQLARALGYAHAQGVVHRDIKPSNIVVRSHDGHVKVLDFGIAQITRSDKVEGSRSGDILGSAHYLSPEQLTEKGLDGRSDLFSVGIVLYQMLTGRKPFASDNFYTLTTQIVRDDPPALADLRPDVPISMRRVVEKCLRKQRERRFQKAEELADALGRVVADLDEESTTPRRKLLSLQLILPAVMGLCALIPLLIASAILAKTLAGADTVSGVERNSLLARILADRLSEPMSLIRDPQQAAAAAVDIEESTRPILSQYGIGTLLVTDQNNTIIAGHGGPAAGSRYDAPAGNAIASTEPDVRVTHLVDPKSGGLVLYSTPIHLNDRVVGNLHLTAPGERKTVRTGPLIGMMALTVILVLLASYAIARSLTRAARNLKEVMTDIANGSYEARIGGRRNDEFGETFRAFDRMAIALQRRAQGERDTTKFDTGES